MAAAGSSPREARNRRSDRGAGSASGGLELERPALDPEESPLTWLRRRRDKSGRPLLTEAAFRAGERLRAEFWFAQMTPRTTTDWSAFGMNGGRTPGRGQPGGGVEVSERAAAAQQRVRSALAAIGPEQADMLVDICCHAKGIEQIELERGWPQRSGKVVLQLALHTLARHYGYLGPNEPAGGRIRQWGEAGYRPAADAKPE